MRICEVEGCDRPHSARGYCGMHYARVRVYGTPEIEGTTERVRHPRSGQCGVEECERADHARGLCLMHLKRVLNHGSTNTLRPRRPPGMPVRAWFMSKVEVTEACWMWRGATHNPTNKRRKRYGVFYDADSGRKRGAHLYLVPTAPEGHEYHHRCGEVLCVRPDHLQLMTISEHRRLPR